MSRNNNNLPREYLEIEYVFTRKTNYCGEYQKTKISGPKKLAIGTAFGIAGVFALGQVVDIPYVPKVSIVHDVSPNDNTIKFPVVYTNEANEESR